MCAKLLQSCPTLCDPMDCSPPGSSVHVRHCRGQGAHLAMTGEARGVSRVVARMRCQLFAHLESNLPLVLWHIKSHFGMNWVCRSGIGYIRVKEETAGRDDWKVIQ